MANASITAEGAIPRPWPGRIFPLAASFFSDGAVRYGIKFGLAGMLAVFLSLLIRLPEPTWALFTVYVLMIAQYVGAIAEKSIFRVFGTIAGGIIGYVLTASLEQEPVVFLTLVGLVVAGSTAMFGQSRYPYAFLLCGLTTVVVVSNGLADPENSWQYMLWRVEEVCVGILATLLVQGLLWPRYSRVEFSQNARAAFADLRECFTASACSILANEEDSAPNATAGSPSPLDGDAGSPSPLDGDAGSPSPRNRAEDFPARITALRLLLDFGARESQHFRHRLPTYFEITNCLSRIASAIVTLGDVLPDGSLYRPTVSDELRAVHAALEAALADLGSDQSTPASRQQHRKTIAAAFQAFKDQLEAMRSDPRVYSVTAEEAMMLGIHALALDDIREHVLHAQELFDTLPQDPTEQSRELEDIVSPLPPPFWIRSGIKSGLAVVVSLILYNWLEPPGGTMFVLGAWVFTATNASSPGGQGDRRAFHYTVYNLVALLVLSLLLLLATPAFSSYAVMNTVIFTWLFVWGYLSYTTHGLTIPMQMGMLLSVGILGLNGQQPVSFQAIVGFFMGIALAQVTAAVIQRLVWPSLPQWELRDRFLEFLRTCREVIESGPQTLPLWKRVRIALIPGEAGQRIGVLGQPICPAGEPQRLQDYLHTLQRIGSHLLVTIGKLDPLLPEPHADRGKSLLRQIEAELTRHLEAHEQGLRNAGPVEIDAGALTAILATWQSWVRELRAWMLEHQVPVSDSVRIVGLAGRYELAGRDLLVAGEEAARLRLALYMGDYVL